ncbi:MAG: 4Fe-4S dicluster domain-containing protein [Candidatus Omnitrophica bacterium]|nr:4Fe-4S dicluster domain-containing protein [Candidatus Omnitrophota bacterium]
MKKTLIFCGALILVTVGLSVYMKWEENGYKSDMQFSQELSLKDLAVKNNVPVKEILHGLSHKDHKLWDLPRNIPIKSLGVNIDEVRHALEHIKEESNPLRDVLKYILWSIWLSFILIVVLQQKRIKKIRIITLLFSVFLFGVILGATPNPMESIVKLFKLFNGMEGDPKVLAMSFLLFTLFSLIGSKFICSWGCQLGALQESIFNIPIFKKKYAFKMPFFISLSVRLVLFTAFIFLLFGIGYRVVHGIKNFVIYHHVNYFKIFNLHDLATIALYTLPILFVVSLFIYRPFCQFICPFGLYSWLLENIAFKKIKIIEDKCIKCTKCVEACPTQAMKEIYEKKRKHFLPDCWSCGACMEACPTDAIEYR